MTRVLVAEEDADTRFRIDEYTRGSRFECLLASGYDEALRFAAQPREKIDILLTSMMLVPYQPGSLANRLRNLHAGLKVIFLTGLDPRVLEASSFLVPGTPVLPNPFTKPRLLATLELVRTRCRPWSDLVAALERA